MSPADREPCTLDALDPAGNGVRVEFFRIPPCWGHRIWAIEAGKSRALLESVEGEDEAFPASPALQQLAMQTVASGRVAMLLGMAGRNHWSMTVEAFADSRRVRFDVACRNQPSADAQLRSTYRSPLSWQPADVGLVVAERPPFRYQLAVQLSDHTNPARLVRSPTGLIVLNVAADSDATTQRWCYELSQRP